MITSSRRSPSYPVAGWSPWATPVTQALPFVLVGAKVYAGFAFAWLPGLPGLCGTVICQVAEGTAHCRIPHCI